MDLNYKNMLVKAKKNIKIHITGCSISIVFSLILFAKVGNFLLFAIFLTALYIWLVNGAVYGDEKKRYEKSTLIKATIIPITLYLDTSGAILYMAHLRVVMISAIMVFSILFLNIIIGISVREMESSSEKKFFGKRLQKLQSALQLF